MMIGMNIFKFITLSNTQNSATFYQGKSYSLLLIIINEGN